MGAVEANDIARRSLFDCTGRSGGFCVAYEEEGVGWVLKEAERENVGGGFLAHHTARQAVDRSRFVFDGCTPSFIACVNLHVAEDFEVGAMAPRRV